MEESLKKKVLEKIKPSVVEEELFSEGVMKLKRKIKRAANSKGYKCEVFIGGSYGKGTYLKGKSDVDFFIRFDLAYKDGSLSHYLEEMLIEAKLKFKKQKGSRDYFSGVFSPRKYNIKFEAVPNFKIRKASDAQNSTDLSPLHVKFVHDKIEGDTKLADEIRITKQFFKAKKLYGAESYVNGFSGHVLDILVINYGSFDKLIEDAKRWEEGKVIDINNVYDSYEKIKKTFGEDKMSSLIVVDPIIKERNAARAVSVENYNRFLFEINTLEKLTQDDFIEEEIDFDDVLSNSKDFAKENSFERVAYRITFDVRNESEDIVGSKLKKGYLKILKYFESFDFKVFYSEFVIDCSKGETVFVYLFEKTSLPKIKKIQGPKVTMKDSIAKFLDKREMHFIEGDRVCSYEARRVTKIGEICKIEIKDLEEMINKDISFVKKLKTIR